MEKTLGDVGRAGRRKEVEVEVLEGGLLEVWMRGELTFFFPYSNGHFSIVFSSDYVFLLFSLLWNISKDHDEHVWPTFGVCCWPIGSLNDVLGQTTYVVPGLLDLRGVFVFACLDQHSLAPSSRPTSIVTFMCDLVAWES